MAWTSTATTIRLGGPKDAPDNKAVYEAEATMAQGIWQNLVAAPFMKLISSRSVALLTAEAADRCP